MAKVEMSIQEYDQMRDKMHLYEEALITLLTPQHDKWDIKYFSEHPGSSICLTSPTVENMPERVKTFLSTYIEQSINKFLEDTKIGIGACNIEEIIEHAKFNIGYLHHPEPMTAAMEEVEDGV